MKIKINDFNLKDTLMSGACFRATLESDGSFTNILRDRIINIRQIGDELIVKSNKLDNLSNVIREYFDLDRDYNIINKELIQVDPGLKDVIECCRGYHILNQDPFEMCISYIISQNNNVKRISKSINDISEKYGEKNNLIIVKGKAGYIIKTEELKEKIYEQISNIHTNYQTIEIPVEYKEPEPINLQKIHEEIYKEPQDAYVQKNPTVVHPEVNGIDFKISVEEAEELLKEDKEEYTIPLKIQ